MEYPKTGRRPLTLLGVGKALLLSTRPRQWTKNLIIYFALFFSVKEAWDLGEPESAIAALGKATLAFALFSALTGAVYLVNDIFDVERDRLHPRKRLRPIAAGQLPVGAAWTAAAVLAVVSVGFAFVLEPLFGWVELAYLGTMIAYTLVLKRVVLLDVLMISGGFVLRAIAGAAVLATPISPWLYTCAGLGALLIALGKRRSELTAAGGAAPRQRETLEWYTPGLIDQLMAVVAPSVLLAYTLYTFTASNLPDNHAMMLTVPFVVYGLFRYIYLVHAKDLGESPEDIFVSDVPLVASIVLWLAAAATILVIFR